MDWRDMDQDVSDAQRSYAFLYTPTYLSSMEDYAVLLGIPLSPGRREYPQLRYPQYPHPRPRPRHPPPTPPSPSPP